MRKLLLSLIAVLPLAGSAQTVADFETPVLPKADTFYLNYGPKLTDRGFDNGLAHFPFYTDSFGTTAFWTRGFTYSNVTNDSTGGAGNQYAAKTGSGANGSDQYAVAQFGSVYGDSLKIGLLGRAVGKGAQGFYVTNSAYGYFSMKFGDGFARKFGDTTGTGAKIPQGSYPDFFRFTVRAYEGGVLKPDTVQFYLADYRFADSTQDYIINDWRWVSLLKLGAADSFILNLESSDTASYGGSVAYLNNPAYFCIDDFTTNESLGVSHNQPFIARVYPNPVQNVLHIELNGNNNAERISLLDMSGRVVISQAVVSKATTLDMSGLAAGNYLLQLQGTSGEIAAQQITKL